MARTIPSLTLVAAVVAACGGAAAPAPVASPTQAAATSAATTAPTAAASAGPVAPLKVAVTSLTIGNAPIYVAIAEGYFKQLNVEVTTIDNASSNLLNLVVTGQADLGQGSNTNALVATAQGKPMSVIYNYQGNAAGGFMAGKNEYTSPSQVKRVGSGGPGTSIYGYCNLYKTQLKASFECVPMADFATRKAAFLSGQVDAVMDVYAQLYDLVESGQAKALIDTRDPAVRKQYVGQDFGEAGIWGLRTTLQSKKESIVRFMKGIGMAMDFMDKATDQQVAASIRKLQIFQGTPEATFTVQENKYRAFNYPNRGYITEGSWTFALSQWAQWGLGADINDHVKDADFQFAKAVDMSFYEAGIGKPKQ